MDHKGWPSRPNTSPSAPSALCRAFAASPTKHGRFASPSACTAPPTPNGRPSCPPRAAGRWPSCIDACRYYSQNAAGASSLNGRSSTAKTTRPAQAHALGQLLQGLEAHVNLIPLNPTHGYDGHARTATAAKAFQEILTGYQPAQHHPPAARHRHRRRLRPAASAGNGRFALPQAFTQRGWLAKAASAAPLRHFPNRGNAVAGAEALVSGARHVLAPFRVSLAESGSPPPAPPGPRAAPARCVRPAQAPRAQRLNRPK